VRGLHNHFHGLEFEYLVVGDLCQWYFSRQDVWSSDAVNFFSLVTTESFTVTLFDLETIHYRCNGLQCLTKHYRCDILQIDWFWLIDCLTARQHRKVNLCQLRGRETSSRIANETQRTTPHVTWQQCNTVHSKTLQPHKRNNRLSNRMTNLLTIMSVPSPIPSQIPHTLFDIISLGVGAVLCHDKDTCKTVHACARRKMPQTHSTIPWIMYSYFPMTGFRATVCASTVDNRYDCAPT